MVARISKREIFMDTGTEKVQRLQSNENLVRKKTERYSERNIQIEKPFEKKDIGESEREKEKKHREKVIEISRDPETFRL